MVVALPFRYDLWSSADPVREEDFIDVHCLIPNGSYISFKCTSKTTLTELKEVTKAVKNKMNHAVEREAKTQKYQNTCVIKNCISLCYHFMDRIFSLQWNSTVFISRPFIGVVGGS